jgi:hypothetical protein
MWDIVYPNMHNISFLCFIFLLLFLSVCGENNSIQSASHVTIEVRPYLPTKRYLF